MQYPLIDQEESMWCWAAVAQSVERYFSPQSDVRQCEIAGAVINVPNACANPDNFNEPNSLEAALTVIGKLEEVVDGPMTFDDVKGEIDRERPICVRIGWRPQGGHFVVLEGYRESGGEQWVSVADPLLTDSTLLYEEFRDAYYFGAGRWTHTFLVHP